MNDIKIEKIQYPHTVDLLLKTGFRCELCNRNVASSKINILVKNIDNDEIVFYYYICPKCSQKSDIEQLISVKYSLYKL